MNFECVELTDAQLKAEMERCEYCEEKPCRDACPANCSPADFIMAAKNGQPRDFERAAAIILGSNPLGGVCGYTCPDYHCMKACSRKDFDRPVNIPAIQSAIIKRAREMFREPVFFPEKPIKKNVAVIGSGPAGLACASVLTQKGYNVSIFEKEKKIGGATQLIPDFRLPKEMLNQEIDFIRELGNIHFFKNVDKMLDHKRLDCFDACVIATGLNEVNELNIPGSEWLVSWSEFLKNPAVFSLKGKKIAIIGGGAVAADVANIAVFKHATQVDMIALEKLSELPLTEREFDDIKASDVVIHQRSKLLEIEKKENSYHLKCIRVDLPKKMVFHPAKLKEIEGSQFTLSNYDLIVLAIGSKSIYQHFKKDHVFYTGDMLAGASTVVEAVAYGKNTAAEVDAFLNNQTIPQFENSLKSTVELSGKNMMPVSLECSFFGKKINSPFLLSAAPPTDGYDQVKKAYEAGWAGAIMKTAFDGIDIHIPSRYMFAVSSDTYANCDNVSAHPLKRVCEEIQKLVAEFPDHLTMASTGGPVTGHDAEDKKVWQNNTLLLEKAGVMGIEYSLS
nr:FAD-dependent oxidoreductase [Candidatus Cloacimonadota bacterium]